ncbi:hypothetical protein D3C85_368230 [compost metagenome]
MYSVCAARLAACTAAWEIGAFGSCAASARLALARVPSAMLLLPLDCKPAIVPWLMFWSPVTNWPARWPTATLRLPLESPPAP